MARVCCALRCAFAAGKPSGGMALVGALWTKRLGQVLVLTVSAHTK